MSGRACRRRNWWSQEAAEAHLKELQERGRGKVPVRVYRCDRCPFWHTTSVRYYKRKKK